jgi:hypothetical protein
MTNSGARATTQELSRLIRRHESGAYPEARLVKRFEEELNRLPSQLVELRPILRGLRHRPAALMEKCDEAINRALGACSSKNYRWGLSWLREAEKTLAFLRDLKDDFEEYDSAMKEYRELLDFLDSEYLRGLPSIKTIALLFAEADKLLAHSAREADGLKAAGPGRQARFIAGICREKVLALQEVTDEGDAEAQQRLMTKIKRQESFRAQTEKFAPSPPVDLKLRRAFERLPVLLAHSRLKLVARLTDEVEGELASRRAVLATYGCYRNLQRSAQGKATQATADEVKRLIYSESWGSASTYLLQQMLAVLAAKASGLRSSVRRASQKLDDLNEAGASLMKESVPNIS